MNVETTLTAISKFCKTNSGDQHTWSGNSGTYQWTLGKETDQGIMNGVVRKLAGIDISGTQIWVVAGSLKILPDGTIARFTGLPKKMQSLVGILTFIETKATEKA
jgi:hypothetical protein